MMDDGDRVEEDEDQQRRQVFQQQRTALVTQVSKIKTNMGSFRDEIENSLNHIMLRAETALKQKKEVFHILSNNPAEEAEEAAALKKKLGEGTDEFISQLQETFLGSIRQLILVDMKISAVEAVQIECRDWDDQKGFPDVENLLEEKLNELPDPSTIQSKDLEKKGNYYKKWMKLIGRDEQDEELEIVQEGSSIPAKCPITMTRMSQPERSRICNHVFSKEGLDIIFKNAPNQQRKCPAAGCNQKNFRSDYVFDKYAELQVQATQREEHYTQKKSQFSQRIDD